MLEVLTAYNHCCLLSESVHLSLGKLFQSYATVLSLKNNVGNSLKWSQMWEPKDCVFFHKQWHFHSVEDELRSPRVWGKKLLCSLVVQQQIFLYLLLQQVNSEQWKWTDCGWGGCCLLVFSDSLISVLWFQSECFFIVACLHTVFLCKYGCS